jgi:hypothetical protein
MKEKLFDFTVMTLVAFFAIDMTTDKVFAAAPKQFDELDALIAKSEKTMKQTSSVVKAAAKKQEAVEQEIVENVEALEETIVETQEKVESLNEEMSIMEEVAEEVAFTVAMSGLDTISANPVDIKQMIKIKKEMKIIDLKIEKALAGDSSADIDDLIILKNMYNLNGVK